ncbi:MAG: DMT family protein [Pseudomonadota bacterium]
MKIPVVAQTAIPLTLSIEFMTFAVCCLRQPLKLDCLRASLCIMGAVYFIFRA